MNVVVVAAGLARMLVAPDSPAPVMEPDDAVLFVQAAGICDGDAGVPDAGSASCGDSVMMVVQPRFSLSPQGARFALLYVTPAAPSIRTESPTTFDDLAAATAPATDTVPVEIQDPALGTRCDGCGNGGGGGGCGWPTDPYGTWSPPSLDGGAGASKLETIGPYDVATTQPASRAQLGQWLDRIGYIYAAADLDALDPYLAMGWYVVAVRVTAIAPRATGLVPLSMTWAGSEIRVPLGLASQSALTVYISAAHRFELPGAHISFAGCLDCNTPSGFVTRNELTDVSADLTATVAPSDDTTRDVNVIYQDVHVPVSKCDDSGGCCQTGGNDTTGALYFAALMAACRRRRSARRRRAARTPV